MKSSLFNSEPCVLVVDDHEISRQHTVQALSSVTIQVRQAPNGKQALECARHMLPYLIFTDIHLPDLCGFTLLHQIRETWSPGKPHPAFVILSGDGSEFARQKAEQSKVNAFLIKPVSSHEIRKLAARLLHLEHLVEECSTGQQPYAGLRDLFLKELDTRLPQLDHDVSSLDWVSAAELIHQLIASSAMCKENNLEWHCRQLYKTLNGNSPVRRVAQAYYSFLQAVDHMRMGTQIP